MQVPKMFLKPRPPCSPFDPPSLLYTFLSSPLKFVLHHTHELLLSLRGPSCNNAPPPSTCIRLVCISDTHTFKPHTTSSATRTRNVTLPPGDVLIHAGDLSNDGSFSAIQDQISWLSSLPYEHKVVIAGNHDSYLDPRSRHPEDHNKSMQWGSVQYLQHSALTLHFPQRGRSLNFYGAPHIPMCGGPEFAFQYQREEDAWSGTIPLGTDILITHTPPQYHLDLPNALGCEWLLREIWKIRPRVHVYGIWPHWSHFTRFATCLDSIYSRDILCTSSLCAQEEMLTPKSNRPCSCWSWEAARMVGWRTKGL